MKKNKTPSIRLGKRIVDENHPPLVIAEVGINHEGDYDKAIQMVDAAAAAGVECVKFQCHITEAEMIKTDMKPGKISDEKLWDIIKRCELTEEQERSIKKYCESKGLIYLCTPFSREASNRLESMGVVGYKIGSGECNNIPLLKHIARFRKPMILSTGMNDEASVKASVKAIQDENCAVMLLHCTSEYPTPYGHVRLGAIPAMKKTFEVPIGLSDHSLGIYTALGAVALGAVVLEKHFTISRSWPGPDCPISIEPQELAELAKGSRAIWEARGGIKSILPTEKPVIDFAYACVVTIKDMKAGEIFSLKNIWVKRPGTGPIKARDFQKILGKKSRRALESGVQLSPRDIA